MPEFWVDTGKKVLGPFDVAKLNELAAAKKLKPNHRLSVDQENWKSATKIRGLTFPGSTKTAQPGSMDSFSPAAAKLPKRRRRTKAVSKPSAPGLIKAPRLKPGERSYLQLLQKGDRAKKVKISEIRRMLIDGELTRHDRIRWIEPEPDRDEFYQEPASDSNEGYDEFRTMDYHDAMKEWKLRRSWRPIGEGLAKEAYRIRVLYEPLAVFRDLGVWMLGIPVFLILVAALSWTMLEKTVDSGVIDTLAESGGQPQSFIEKMSQTLERNEMIKRFVIPILIGIWSLIVGGSAAVAWLIGYVFGGGAGLLLGKCIRPLLAKPPPDQFVADANAS